MDEELLRLQRRVSADPSPENTYGLLNYYNRIGKGVSVFTELKSAECIIDDIFEHFGVHPSFRIYQIYGHPNQPWFKYNNEVAVNETYDSIEDYIKTHEKECLNFKNVSFNFDDFINNFHKEIYFERIQAEYRKGNYILIHCAFWGVQSFRLVDATNEMSLIKEWEKYQKGKGRQK